MDGVKPVELQEPLEELARDPTRFTHDLMFPAADRIRVYDDTLRDGEQMPGVAITPENKYQLARMLSDIGVHSMDVGFPPVWFYRAANVRMMCDAIKYAREQGATSIEFGGEDGSRADVNYIAELHTEGLRAGGTRPSTPDTVGCYSPFAVRDYIPRIKAAAPDAPLVVHFHNDLGLGAWNTVMALGSGAEVFTTSVNGIGERTGNAPMHQVLLQLRYLFGIEIPHFKYEKLRELARSLERMSGIPVQPTEPGIGLNVFSHESGIHTAGMLIHPAIYQFIPPEDMGAEIAYVYGKHSGTLVIEHALRGAKITPDPKLVARVLEEVKRIREERAEQADFSEFHRQYYDHLNRLGLTADEVVDIAKALMADQKS